MRMRYILKQLNVEGETFEFSSEREYTCGRGKDNEINCPSFIASRRHCKFRLSTKKGLQIMHWKGLNGTFVNGEEISAQTPYTLKSNDIIGIGSYDINDANPEGFFYELKCEEKEDVTLVEKRKIDQNAVVPEKKPKIDDLDDEIIEIPKEIDEKKDGEDVQGISEAVKKDGYEEKSGGEVVQTNAHFIEESEDSLREKEEEKKVDESFSSLDENLQKSADDKVKLSNGHHPPYSTPLPSTDKKPQEEDNITLEFPIKIEPELDIPEDEMEETSQIGEESPMEEELKSESRLSYPQIDCGEFVDNEENTKENDSSVEESRVKKSLLLSQPGFSSDEAEAGLSHPHVSSKKSTKIVDSSMAVDLYAEGIEMDPLKLGAGEYLEQLGENLEKNLASDSSFSGDCKYYKFQKSDKKLGLRCKVMVKRHSERSEFLTIESSSSDEEEQSRKFEKKAMKLSQKQSNDDDSNKEDGCDASDDGDDSKKKKKRIRRRRLNSDSDIQLTDESQSQSGDNDDDDVNNDKRKGKKGKKRAKKIDNSSDSSSSTSRSRPKPKRRRVRTANTDSDSDIEEINNSQGSPNKSGRKNIRKVMKDKQGVDDTKKAAKQKFGNFKTLPGATTKTSQNSSTRPLPPVTQPPRAIITHDPDIIEITPSTTTSSNNTAQSSSSKQQFDHFKTLPGATTKTSQNSSTRPPPPVTQPPRAIITLDSDIIETKEKIPMEKKSGNEPQLIDLQIDYEESVDDEEGIFSSQPSNSAHNAPESSHNYGAFDADNKDSVDSESFKDSFHSQEKEADVITLSDDDDDN